MMQPACNFTHNIANRNLLQVAENMFHVAISSCNLQSKTIHANVASPNRSCNKLQRGHVTHCNLSATSLATLQKEIYCKLQETCYTLESRATTCNLKQSMQMLQAQTSRATSCKEGKLHTATFLQLLFQRCKKKYIASCRRHVTRSNLEL